MSTKSDNRQARKNRIRAVISGTSERPRLSVFRSNKHMYAQIINDESGKVICESSDLKLEKSADKKNKSDIAKHIGETLAEKAIKNKVKAVVFDRSGYKYHGRVKALAEGAKNKGLEF